MLWNEITVDVPASLRERAETLLRERGLETLHELPAASARVRLRGHVLWNLDADALVGDVRSAVRALPRDEPGARRVSVRRVQFASPVADAGGSGWCFDEPMPVLAPTVLGERLVIKDPGHDFPAEPHHVIVELAPTRAFGNGAHETTRLCMRALERHLRPGVNAVDVGTGSGLLALAMGRLGAGRVMAFDIEEAALRSTRENTSLNRLDGVITAAHADSFVGWSRRLVGRVGLVAANLLPHVVCEIAPQVAQMLTADGVFVVSGLRVDAVAGLDEVLLGHGFEVCDVDVEGEWVCLVYTPARPDAGNAARALLLRLGATAG
ncbi:MAG: hypothetical protein EB084_08305 [Proteobacteria bacterium]|nr:hypothetical protein [Pseudomonadota bacterium]